MVEWAQPVEGQEPTAPFTNPVPLETCRIDHAGLGLHVRLWGDRRKPPVLLQHGARDTGRTWDWLIAALVEDFYCIVPDLRGHGWSDWALGGGYDDVSFVADMAIIVQTMRSQGVTTPIPIVGHSAGGHIALHFAAAYPEYVDRLIVAEGLGLSHGAYAAIAAKNPADRWRAAIDRRVARAQAAPRQASSLAAAERRMRQLHPRLSDAHIRHLTAIGGVAADKGWRWRHDPCLAMLGPRPVAPASYGDVYARIECAVTLVYGGESFAEVPGEDGRLAPFRDVDLVVFETATHDLHHERTEDFVALVAARLAR